MTADEIDAESGRVGLAKYHELRAEGMDKHYAEKQRFFVAMECLLTRMRQLKGQD